MFMPLQCQEQALVQPNLPNHSGVLHCSFTLVVTILKGQPIVTGGMHNVRQALGIWVKMWSPVH